MNDRLVITSHVIIDETMRYLNHRSHALALDTLGELFAGGALFIIDSMPLPVGQILR